MFLVLSTAENVVSNNWVFFFLFLDLMYFSAYTPWVLTYHSDSSENLFLTNFAIIFLMTFVI